MENECTQRETEEPLPGSSDQRASPVLAVEPPSIAIIVSRNYCPAESRGRQNRLRTVKGLPKKSRQPSRDSFQSIDPLFQLGSAALALALVLVFFVLALAALLLLILLVLLTGLLAGLAALLAGLTGLTALSTLLSVLIHIICHENSPPFKCASRRII
jgi:hypothetical protein